MDIAQRFRDIAQRFPHKPFILCKDQSISYGEAAKRINKLANCLFRQGVRQGDKVAVYLPNSPEYIFSYLAVFSLGAACVPLDVRLTEEEITGVLTHSQTSLFITKPLEKLSFSELPARVPGLKNIIKCLTEEEDRFLNFDRIMQEESEQPLEVKIDEQGLAILYYTSGTTGRPKAVMTNYRSLDNAAQTARYFGFTEETMGNVAICALPLSH